MKKLSAFFLAALMVLCLGACSGQPAASGTSSAPAGSTPASASEPASTTPVDATAMASEQTNLYTNLNQAELLEAMAQYRGLCTVATVNADGTPNLAIFVPGVAGENHIMFGWAENATKTNFLRDGVAMLSYDIANPSAETKEERHQGAIVRLELESDEAVLEEIKANLPEAVVENFDSYVFCRIVEVLPIG